MKRVHGETKFDAATIQEKANEARAYILMAIYFAGSGHPGGSLSVIDIESTLYLNVLRHDQIGRAHV